MIILPLLGVISFCLFFSYKLKLNSGLLPLPVLAASAVWLTLFGMAGHLKAGGILWLLLSAISFLTLLLPSKQQSSGPLKRLGSACSEAMQPGFLFFITASLFIIILFSIRRPMFIRWDEFSFWGTACKMTKDADMLHTVAPGNMRARAYLPGMQVLSYLFQLLGGKFSEWQCLAAYDITAAAVFAAFGAENRKKWHISVLLLAGAVLLPYFFVAPGDSSINTVYLTAMGDVSLGLVFGGALCLYLRTEGSREGMILTGLTLMLLTLIKDMGFAYALIAAALIAADRLFFPKVCLKSLISSAVGFIGMAAAVVGTYGVWSVYVLRSAGIDKNVASSNGVSYGYGEMLKDGMLQFLGKGSPEMRDKFVMVLTLTKNAFVHTPLSMLGSCTAVLMLLAAVIVLGLLLSARGSRRRSVVYAIVSFGCFAALMLFHLLLYVYSFSMKEASVLKDYDRYIATFLTGWMLASLCLFRIQTERGICPKAGEAASAAFSLLFICFMVRGLPAAGIWNYPRENYAERLDVSKRAELLNNSLSYDDEVLLISQGDDGTRWYYYSYELNATMAMGYGGYSYTDEKQKQWNASWDTTFMSLVSPYKDSWQSDMYAFQKEYEYTAYCTAKDLEAFLRDKGYAYILLDESDLYIFYEFEDLFPHKGVPVGHEDAAYLYRIVDDGQTMHFEAAGEVRYEES